MGFRNNNQGYYKPLHPEKYVSGKKDGALNKKGGIRFMSSWELQTCKFLDMNPNVLRWSSEEIAIPYIKPTTGRVHKYFPDYWVEYKNKNGKLISEIWEVKPDAQTKPPKTTGKNKKRQLWESINWAINVAKWEAATLFCRKYGLKFRIVREMDIFK